MDLALPQHVDRVDMKVVYSNTLVEDGTSAGMQQHSHSHTHSQQQAQQQQPPQNLVPEEFSDTEDMLEGKVLIEDTCDAMDLMTPTSNGVRPHW